MPTTQKQFEEAVRLVVERFTDEQLEDAIAEAELTAAARREVVAA